MFKLRLRKVLAEKGISMSRLSRDADIALNMVWKMCNDPTYNPTSATILKVAKYLKVSVEDLLYENTESPGPAE
jgi:transcriptional regulator with XRE-family HTH domain